MYVSNCPQQKMNLYAAFNASWYLWPFSIKMELSLHFFAENFKKIGWKWKKVQPNGLIGLFVYFPFQKASPKTEVFLCLGRDSKTSILVLKVALIDYPIAQKMCSKLYWNYKSCSWHIIDNMSILIFFFFCIYRFNLLTDPKNRF